MPTVPTFAEQGVGDMVHKVYFSFFAHAKTPPDVMANHSAALRAALNRKEVGETLGRVAMEVAATDMSETAEILARDRAKWASLVARIGYKPA